MEITAVSIDETESLPRVGPPKALFPLPSESSSLTITNSPDGQRFLIPVPVGEAIDPPITLIFNWPKFASGAQTAAEKE